MPVTRELDPKRVARVGPGAGDGVVARKAGTTRLSRTASATIEWTASILIPGLEQRPRDHLDNKRLEAELLASYQD